MALSFCISPHISFLFTHHSTIYTNLYLFYSLIISVQSPRALVQLYQHSAHMFSAKQIHRLTDSGSLRWFIISHHSRNLKNAANRTTFHATSEVEAFFVSFHFSQLASFQWLSCSCSSRDHWIKLILMQHSSSLAKRLLCPGDQLTLLARAKTQ